MTFVHSYLPAELGEATDGMHGEGSIFAKCAITGECLM